MPITTKFDTLVQELKWRVLKEIAAAYWDGTLTQEEIDAIPQLISPGPKASMRCCIYKEREIIRERIKLALGGNKANPNLLEVIEAACDQCPFGGIEVTDLCRGCLAHRCAQACHRNAISFGPDLRANINKDLCVNCGLCAKACQFQAIANRKRPCEAACKIGAIHAREDGISEIDESKCVRCAQCSFACPFGAIMDKSYITKCIDLIRESDYGRKTPLIMVVAPSVSSQFHYARLTQVFTGIKELGFSHVAEAALGADLVAINESQDLVKEGSCTSSCCPAFVRYVQTAFPELSDKVSKNFSPMAAMAKLIKQQVPEAKVVFCGPCIAKKMEMFREDSARYVDCVITFEELQALIDSRGIILKDLPDTPLDIASYFGRIFARSGGLSDAVVEALKEQAIDFEVIPVKVSGLDQCKMALTQMKQGKLPGNFIEGMACPGGCIGGPCALTHEMRAPGDVDKYGRTTTVGSILEAVNMTNAPEHIASNRAELGLPEEE